MSTITLEEAQTRLPELIEQLRPGEEMTITDHGRPLAQLNKAERTSWPCKAGSYRKAEFWMAPAALVAIAEGVVGISSK